MEIPIRLSVGPESVMEIPGHLATPRTRDRRYATDLADHRLGTVKRVAPEDYERYLSTIEVDTGDLNNLRVG